MIWHNNGDSEGDNNGDNTVMDSINGFSHLSKMEMLGYNMGQSMEYHWIIWEFWGPTWDNLWTKKL